MLIDNDVDKVGREIQGIPVWSEDKATFRRLSELEVQEIVFAIPSMDVEKKKTTLMNITKTQDIN